MTNRWIVSVSPCERGRKRRQCKSLIEQERMVRFRCTRLFKIIASTTLLLYFLTRRSEIAAVGLLESFSSATATVLEGRTAAAATKVVIVRTVSPAEVSNVIADIARVNTYQESLNPRTDYLAQSLSRCDAEFDSLNPIEIVNASHTFPNYVLCDDDRTRENHYMSTRADFLLFALNGESVERISSSLKGDYKKNLLVETVDVSDHPVKIWNWITRLTEAQLYGYDYVWMMDGDIQLRTLNWQAFWQQVKLTKPKLSQPCIIGASSGVTQDYQTSDHPILRCQVDSRMIAAETAIIELGAPLFEVNTWLGYREVIANQPRDLTDKLKAGGEDCFDIAWCHYAKAQMVGNQSYPMQGHWFDTSTNPPSYTPGKNSTIGFEHRSCVIFYQTPIVHGDQKTLVKSIGFKKVGNHVCLFFRRNYHIYFAVRTVYEKFVALLKPE